MNKNIFFAIALIIPITLIGIGIYSNDIERIERAFYLLLSFCGAFLAASFREFKSIKIVSKTKKKIIISFVVALFVILFAFLLNQIYVGCLIACIIGLYPFWVIEREKAH